VGYRSAVPRPSEVVRRASFNPGDALASVKSSEREVGKVRATPSDGVNFIPYMKLLGVE
jgi:hypothetical protein